MNDLRSLGYTGTYRTTRRALAEIKSQWRLGNTRVHRPWITEPGLWLQYDFADGPIVAGRKVVLVGGVVGVVPIPGRHSVAGSDRAQRSSAGLDWFFRILGGAPTYLLTDYVARHIIGVLCPAVLCARLAGNVTGAMGVGLSSGT